MNDIHVLGIRLPLLIAELGMLVTVLSAIVGVWIERDRSKPIKKAVALTVLVIFGGGASAYQAYDDDQDQVELEEGLAKILEQLDQVAVASEVELPDLNEALKSELLVHGRANPKVLRELAKRIAAKGGDPVKMLAAYLPEADLQAMMREGKFEEALAEPKFATATDTKRPKLVFGSEATPFVRPENSDIADAGVPDAATGTVEVADGGDLDGGLIADASVDASTDASTDAAAEAGAEIAAASATNVIAGERETLKRQIDEARRLVAEAKTPQEKKERQKKLFELLGALDKLEKAAPKTAPATTSSATPTKKPRIEIEEDGNP